MLDKNTALTIIVNKAALCRILSTRGGNVDKTQERTGSIGLTLTELYTRKKSKAIESANLVLNKILFNLKNLRITEKRRFRPSEAEGVDYAEH